MTTETEQRLAQVEELLHRIREAARYSERAARLEELDQAMGVEGFWDDPESAQKTIGERKVAATIVRSIDDLAERLEDVKTLLELGQEEEDENSLTEAEEESHRLLASAESLEVKTVLNGKFDSGNCYLTIKPGAGGTESCDWASMVYRMYLRFAERNGFKITVLEEQPAEEAGIQKATIHIQGPYAFGYLKAERGPHRLVRISPFDANSRRHTSFVGVAVTPEVEDIEIEINESDLRVDTYRASGAGGQHVNTTDSAVRITHEPTGIVVTCQNERSQHSNRAAAMRVLMSRLHEFEEEKRQKEIDNISGEKGDIAFGNQIRSYVLAPYKMVKDHRTSHETGSVDHVLDGDLMPFIEAYLRQTAQA